MIWNQYGDFIDLGPDPYSSNDKLYGSGSTSKKAWSISHGKLLILYEMDQAFLDIQYTQALVPLEIKWKWYEQKHQCRQKTAYTYGR